MFTFSYAGIHPNYTGVTDNLEKRISEHEIGIDPKCYTFNRRPVKLVFQEAFNDPITAIEREKQIKGWSRKKKEALIRGDWDRLQRLARSTSRTR
jgi:putative endonuclease